MGIWKYTSNITQNSKPPWISGISRGPRIDQKMSQNDQKLSKMIDFEDFA